MTFLWPKMLLFLLLVPALVAGYWWLLRRRRTGVRYASLTLIRAALGPGTKYRRHVPPALFILSLTVAILAMARPTAVVTLPSEERTIIMVIDVSLSMKATDVEPNRLAAAQVAAKSFISNQPKDVKIGLVEFAGTASISQPPTHNRDDLIAAVDRLDVQRHTAIGSAIIVAMAALFPDAGYDVATFVPPGGSVRDKQRGASLDKKDEKPKAAAATPMPPGSYQHGAIIMLTDGRRTIGPDPLDAARMAAERGVRIFTLGLGTSEGGMAGFEGMSIYMRFDEETLRGIADITKGEFFAASSAEQLKNVYNKLNAEYVLERKQTEISAIVTSIAALLLLLAGILSVRWFHRS
jgi:Ca-activated chloride channel family protein